MKLVKQQLKVATHHGSSNPLHTDLLQEQQDWLCLVSASMVLLTVGVATWCCIGAGWMESDPVLSAVQKNLSFQYWWYKLNEKEVRWVCSPCNLSEGFLAVPSIQHSTATCALEDWFGTVFAWGLLHCWLVIETEWMAVGRLEVEPSLSELCKPL